MKIHMEPEKARKKKEKITTTKPLFGLEVPFLWRTGAGGD